MDAQEVSDLVNEQVDARLDVRMKELGVNKLNETFTRYRIIATTIVLFVGLLIGTQAYTK